MTNIVRQTSFSAGEVDDIQDRRTDSSLYLKALQRGQNVLVETTGLLRKRYGTKSMMNVNAYADTSSRLLPYADKHGNQYIIILRAYNFNIFEYQVAADTLVFIATVTHPYDSSEIGELDYTLDNDNMIIAHGNHMPGRLYISNYTTTTFTYEEMEIYPQPAYDFNNVYYNDSTAALTVSNGILTLTLSGFSEPPAFTDDWIGGQIIGGGASVNSPTGYAIITNVGFSGNSVSFTGIVQVPFETQNPQTLGSAYSIRQPVFTAALGFPKYVAYFQDRLWYANTLTLPATVFGSTQNSPLNFNVGAGYEPDAIIYKIGENNPGPITGINAGKQLEIYTTNYEFVCPQTGDEGLTPGNFSIRHQSSYGSLGTLQALTYGNDSYYIARGGQVVVRFEFNGIGEAYTSTPMNIQSTHLIKNPIARALKRADDVTQDNYIYYLNNDHTMTAFQFVTGEPLAALTEITFQENVEVYGIVSIDNTIFVLKRYTLTSQLFLEKLNEERNSFMDGTQVHTINNSVISGLDHYNGYTVGVMINDEDYGEYNVSQGKITIDDGDGISGNVLVGLPFSVLIQSMNIFLSPSLTDAYKQLLRIYVDYYESLDFSIDATLVEYQSFLQIQTEEPLAPLTGTAIQGVSEGFARNSTISITQQSPYDLSIQSISYQITGALI